MGSFARSLRRKVRRRLPGTRRARILARLGIFVALFYVLSSIVVPAAQAASSKYADDVSTAEGQSRKSGLRSSITGGKAAADLGIGNSTIATYYEYPGYNVVAHAVGPNPYDVYLSHKRYSNAYSKCYWSSSGVGGSADISCWVYW